MKCNFEGITTHIPEMTFNLTCSPQYTKWFEQLLHNWSPIIPKFDLDLDSSPRTSQPSQFSNSIPSPMELACNFQPNFSARTTPASAISSLMGENNLPSLHLDTSSLLAPTRGRRRRREPSSLQPLPRLFHSTSTPTRHTYASQFFIYP